jgi:hypothetical protein
MSALKVEFDLLTGNRDVERLDVLRRQIFSIMNETMKEMRKFIDKSGTKVSFFVLMASFLIVMCSDHCSIT